MGEFSPPFFRGPFFLSFSYPSNIDLKHLNQALVLLYYYKNSPPISKSWIRTCSYLLTGLFLLCDVVPLVNVLESVLLMPPSFKILSRSDSFTVDSKLPERGELARSPLIH